MPENTKGKLSSIRFSRRKPREIAEDVADGSAIAEADEVMADMPDAERQGMAKYRQILERIVINGLLNIAEEKLSDADFIESAFSKTYELLPTPVRMVVSRQWCLRYLHSRKAPLLLQLQQYRVARAESNALTGPETGSEMAFHEQAPPAP
ncbi:hypothetical protein [Citrobacter sp. RHBSTW-00271]|uniref:hypothetical protein n=1 Tax=Citrobacter sp. RHBSTW-00271 TaxID=2742642 RepID=UPI0015FCC480|nr:hypothetical protein [Citrobacter sp. RHBSTW-00271]MBA7942492.1 hypothetical protein [Citrobacter sp. RHBSTW-00271]